MRSKQTDSRAAANVGAAVFYEAAGLRPAAPQLWSRLLVALTFVTLTAAAWFAPESARAETSPDQDVATEAVEEAREALGSHRRFPWYDETDDGVRRVNVKVPWRAPDVDINPGSGGALIEPGPF